MSCLFITGEYTTSEIQGAIEKAIGGSVFRIPVPVRLLEVLEDLRVPLPFKRDQLSRLTMRKLSDNYQAKADHDFAPRYFLDFLRQDASR